MNSQADHNVWFLPLYIILMGIHGHLLSFSIFVFFFILNLLSFFFFPELPNLGPSEGKLFVDRAKNSCYGACFIEILKSLQKRSFYGSLVTGQASAQ